MPPLGLLVPAAPLCAGLAANIMGCGANVGDLQSDIRCITTCMLNTSNS
ncbi:hypothetical protein U128_02490 [Anaplasma marginale str. Gypsy Plains]|nr:hypothetical protein U128_02490 [Anaplasma marginale str. Gypsy Plains]